MNNILNDVLFEAFANASENVYIYVCDMRTDESRWSKNTIDYFSMPCEYMKGAGMIWLEKIHPQDRDVYLTDIQAVFSGQSQHHNCQYRALNKYGDYIWLECRGSVICDEDNQPLYFAGMMTRISAQNKYDPLTNLLTVHELYKTDLLKEGIMILMGFDSFRKIINNYGYTYGDMILKEFSSHVVKILTNEKIFRFNGDQFIIVCENYGHKQAQDLFMKLIKIIKEIGKNLEPSVTLNMTAGAVVYPDDGSNKEELLSNLEHSLEHAKEKHRGEIVFFSQDIAKLHLRTLKIKQELTKSIQRNYENFELYYQPIIHQHHKNIVACEALLRWHTSIDQVSPIEFIKLLEESGEIRSVGLWVMEEVFKQAQIWQKEYPTLRINFNVSYLQFEDKTFIESLVQKADEYRVDKSLIVIELTESCHVENIPRLSEIFGYLRSKGFKIALDDFGTAYSSLNLLKSLPADYIKIDQSLVKEISLTHNQKDMIIIDYLTELSHRLEFECIIEGVEDYCIEQALMHVDAPYFQGYYYARPLSKEEFEKLLQK
ncbi:bifunctional diguanylate cyclase/phosphodiesterase [Candidatus Stoquefichus massiliensis]|uniref:bifunctional diguanylate cyclase/phosphodiesterase n=1 Tax=Candidatus Stoquefichus massiliensis TaxID=1470350 RepID=UPI000480E4FC|nr:GGDEF and EAL domain-containing protein [Candidatus Stoquefichus massiliensis]